MGDLKVMKAGERVSSCELQRLATSDRRLRALDWQVEPSPQNDLTLAGWSIHWPRPLFWFSLRTSPPLWSPSPELPRAARSSRPNTTQRGHWNKNINKPAVGSCQHRGFPLPAPPPPPPPRYPRVSASSNHHISCQNKTIHNSRHPPSFQPYKRLHTRSDNIFCALRHIIHITTITSSSSSHRHVGRQ